MMMMMMMMMIIMSMVTAMMMVVCDHEYDDDIQVNYFFIPRRPLMQEVSFSFIAGGEHFFDKGLLLVASLALSSYVEMLKYLK